METKPWYLSKTIIGTVVCMVAAMLAVFHVKIPGIETQGITDAVFGVTSGLASLLAIYGRVTAKASIETSSNPATMLLMFVCIMLCTLCFASGCAIGFSGDRAVKCDVGLLGQQMHWESTVKGTYTPTEKAPVIYQAPASANAITPASVVSLAANTGISPVGPSTIPPAPVTPPVPAVPAVQPPAATAIISTSQTAATERAQTATANPPASEKGVQSVPASAPAG